MRMSLVSIQTQTHHDAEQKSFCEFLQHPGKFVWYAFAALKAVCHNSDLVGGWFSVHGIIKLCG